MRLQRLLAALSLVVSFGVLTPVHAQPGDGTPEVFEVSLHDTMQPVSADALQRAINLTRRQGGTAVLVNLSTPGGMASSADAMVSTIENSTVPVIVFAAMPNTRISGEGLRVLAASHVAAMAPGTYLTPMLTDPPRSRSAAVLAKDGAALAAALTSLSIRRGRSGAIAESLASGKEWISADWARSDGFVDMVAEDEASLLRAVDGRTVNLRDGRRVRLNLAHATLTQIEPTIRERLMRALMNPDLTVLLLTLGGLLIYLEFNTPGTILPGAAGLLLVLLAVYALHLLPLRSTSLLLLVLSAFLLVLETRFARHGFLATAGVCVLPIGLANLVNGPVRELEVGWPTAIGAGLGFGGVTAVLILLGMQARRAKRRTGAEAMLGWFAVAHTALSPEGRVLVRGELWRARLTSNETSVDAGARVRVLRAEGQMLEVTAIVRPQES